MFEIITTALITTDQIYNAFIGVFENGMSPWLGTCDAPGYQERKTYEGDFQFTIRYDDPDQDEEGDHTGKKTIGPEDVKKGLQKMADDYPTHFNDLVSDNDDGTTHDVFLQCIVLGDIVYG